MNFLLNALTALIAVLHLYFLYLEMFLWNTPQGHKIFKNDADFAKKSAVLAANQGLYNGFLAAGLIWSVLAVGTTAMQLKIFFLSCVMVAGLYGGYSANKKILVIQALPAIIVLTLITLFGVSF